MTTVNSLPYLRRAVAFTVVALFLLTGCGRSSAQPVAAPVAPEGPPQTSVGAPTPPVAIPKVEMFSALANRIKPLSSAVGVPTPSEARLPVALSIPELRIDRAPILPVGVEPNGEMEIPPADEVGWYQFGASPGEAGSAVLAAHVAFDGRDGVFRYLTDLEPGAAMQIEFADGLVADFVVASQAQYDKGELPFDAIFAREGLPSVALITCGGSFNSSLRSYDDNLVAYAIPVVF